MGKLDIKIYHIKKKKDGSMVLKEYQINEESVVKATATAIISGSMLISRVHAENDILAAFKPILQMLQDFAEPAAYAGYIMGFVQIMTENKHKAMTTIKNVSIGYIGINFIPIILATLKKTAVEAANKVGW